MLALNNKYQAVELGVKSVIKLFIQFTNIETYLRLKYKNYLYKVW